MEEIHDRGRGPRHHGGRRPARAIRAAEPPRGKPLDCSTASQHFDTREDSWGQWHDASTGQEILTGTDPLHRYGIGVLFAGATDHGTDISGGQATLPAGNGVDDLAGVTGL